MQNFTCSSSNSTNFLEEIHGEEIVQITKSPDNSSKDRIEKTTMHHIEEHISDHDDFNVLFNFREWQASNHDNPKVTKPTDL